MIRLLEDLLHGVCKSYPENVRRACKWIVLGITGVGSVLLAALLVAGRDDPFSTLSPYMTWNEVTYSSSSKQRVVYLEGLDVERTKHLISRKTGMEARWAITYGSNTVLTRPHRSVTITFEFGEVATVGDRIFHLMAIGEKKEIVRVSYREPLTLLMRAESLLRRG